MSWAVAYFVLQCAGVSLLLETGVQGTFLVKPTSVVVPVESTATFKCRAIGVGVYWYIDHEQATYQHFQERGVSGASELLTDGSWSSTLSVSAIPANNNSIIECAVFNFETGETRTPEVHVIIVGKIQAPVNLKILNSNGSCIQLSWMLPDNITQNVHIGFNIYVNNTQTVGDYDEIIPVEVDTTTFTYIPIDPSPCHVYEFHVTITHEGGEGKRSEVIEGSFVTEPSSIQAESVEVVVGFLLNDINITLMIKLNDSCNVDNYTVHLNSEGTFGCIHTGLLGTTVDGGDIIALTFAASSHEVEENTHYSVVITAVNDIGHTNSSGMIRASTFDVQEITLEEETPGRLCLTCYFARGSNAIGCNAFLENTNIEDTVSIFRAPPAANNASMCIDVIKGIYNISVYDLEDLDKLSQLPAFETSKTVEGGTTPPTTEAGTGETVSIGTIVGVTIGILIITGAAIGVSIIIFLIRKHQKPGSQRVLKGILDDTYAGKLAGNPDSPIIESPRVQGASEETEIETRRNRSYEAHVPKDALQRNPAYETVKGQQTV